MKQPNRLDLQEEWAQLSIQEVEKMLASELEKHSPDDDIVLTLLHILEEKEEPFPLQLTSREEEALERYRRKARNRRNGFKLPFGWFSVAASVLLVVAMLFVMIPQKAEAETFWEMVQRMTHTVLEYISPKEKLFAAESEYIFLTENSGLQQIYDAVIELGVTEPVVPMWLPDGYEIAEFKIKNTPMANGIWASFSNGQQELVFKVDIYNGEPAHQYYKDDTHYESQEWDGTTYNIAKNVNEWVVVWTKENIECSLTLDCQEDTLWKILESIYVTEDD